MHRDAIGGLLMSHEVPLINYAEPSSVATVAVSNANVTSSSAATSSSTSSSSRASATVDCRLLSAAKTHALYLQQRQQQRASSVAAFNIASLAHQFKYPSCTNDTAADASSSNSSCLWWLSFSHRFIFHLVTNVSERCFLLSFLFLSPSSSFTLSLSPSLLCRSSSSQLLIFCLLFSNHLQHCTSLLTTRKRKKKSKTRSKEK